MALALRQTSTRRAKRSHLTALACLSLSIQATEGAFVPLPTRYAAVAASSGQYPITSCQRSRRRLYLVQEESNALDEGAQSIKESPMKRYAKAYSFLGVASVVSWTLVSSTVLLQPHPDPKLAQVSTLLHNICTTAQALAFPLPILWATFSVLHSAATVGSTRSYRRLNTALAATSIWLALSAAFPPTFAFGYSMIPAPLRLFAIVTHLSSAYLAIKVWHKSTENASLPTFLLGLTGSLWKIPPSNPSDDPKEPSIITGLYSFVTAGFLGFTLLPLMTGYPLATIPSILGKRLCRVHCAFSWLAAVVAYSLKDASERGRLEKFCTLRRALTVSCASHLGLVALKLVGIDGGGWILPGRGLWSRYPAMLAAPGAAAAMWGIYGMACLAEWRIQKAA